MNKATKIEMTDKELDKIYEHTSKPMGSKESFLKLSREVAQILEREGKFDRSDNNKQS